MDFICEKIRVMTDELKKLINKPICDIECEYVYAPEYKKDNTPPPKDAPWKLLEKDKFFKGRDEHYWFHFSVPAMEKKQNKELRLSVFTGLEDMWSADNPQGIVYLNGVTAQALDTNHTWIPLEYEKEYDVYVYFFSSLNNDNEYRMNYRLTETDLMVEKLYYHLLVPYDCMLLLDSNSYDYVQIRDCINKALFNLDLRDVQSDGFLNSVKQTIKYLDDEFYGKLCGNSKQTVSCIGHTHIDLAWLWTVQQSKEKSQRSFSTVNSLMKRYDDYVFMSSQPQLYQYVKENDKPLYDEIKKRVSEGRWEVEGAMWIEADTNLASGESLVRQIIHGKKFMKEEFGVESNVLWLPDVFGYSAALPQILKKCNVGQFFTTKIYWNETNSFPYDTFMWQGIDGSEVFSTIIREYGHTMDAKTVFDKSNEYKDKSFSTDNLLTFGYADGGGGTTAEMLEYYRRLNRGIPGMPKAVIKKAGEYLNDLESEYNKKAVELRKENKWVGELYLEMHRGTYTSMAKNKKNNRLSENGIMKAEELSVADMIFNRGKYPEEELNDIIKLVLLNQFHDILPGSCIKEVYDVTDVEYSKILSELSQISLNKIASIASQIETNGGIFVYNPAPFSVTGIVEYDNKQILAEDIPAHGWKVVEEKLVDNFVNVSDYSIENNLIKVEFNEEYEIVSVFDKEANREVIPKNNTANRLEVFEDYPRNYDAWEITDYYKQKVWTVNDVSNVTLLNDGIEVRRKYMNSEIKQRICLNDNSKRIDFKTEVDWHEDHVLLKAAFPVNILANNATYDIQFGNIERPTHRNTSWDAAKFEVCAHKWADLSESGYGVSVLNDCKYGYSIEKNVISISLLKAATYPNPEADRGMHTFTYSLYPHIGDFREGKTVIEGYKINMPLEAFRVDKNAGILPDNMSLISADKENIVIETIKKAEDDNSIIVRMYESYNSKVRTKITVGFPFKEVYICDMLENNIKKLTANNQTIDIDLSNFEIVTLKFVI